MAVRNPDDGVKQTDSYNVIVGVDSVDRGLSRINLVNYILGTGHVQALPFGATLSFGKSDQ